MSDSFGQERNCHIIHTVGPIWHEGRFNEPEVLKLCYENSLQEAAEYGCRCYSDREYDCCQRVADELGIYG